MSEAVVVRERDDAVSGAESFRLFRVGPTRQRKSVPRSQTRERAKKREAAEVPICHPPRRDPR